jgi:hypothetical protein
MDPITHLLERMEEYGCGRLQSWERTDGRLVIFRTRAVRSGGSYFWIAELIGIWVGSACSPGLATGMIYQYASDPLV